MDDIDEILEALTNAWKTVAAQVATIWVPIQFVLIVLAALAGWGVAALIRKRVDIVKLTASWPVYPRIAARAAIENLGIIVAIVLLFSMYAGMRTATLPSRRPFLNRVVWKVALSALAAVLVSATRTPVIR